MAEAVPTFGKPWDTVQPPLSKPILDTVSSMGFENMTPVQEAAIPVFIKNRDVVVEAATGSGKTMSFIIPILELLNRNKPKLAHSEVGAIIISPTRELAKQIFTVLEGVLQLTGFQYKAHLVVGGSSSATNTADELSALKEIGPDILVGTPGRLEDVLCGRLKNGKKTKSGKITASGGIRGRRSASAAKLEVLVLDEADRLLDMGFEASLTAIFSVLPKQRRTGLFSATMSEALNQLVRTGLRNPVRVQVKVQDKDGAREERRIPSTLSIKYLVCPPDRKLAQVLRHIQSNDAQKYIIYFSTCAAVDYFYKLLRRLLCPTADIVPGGRKVLKEERERTRGAFNVEFPISVFSLHGQMVQKKRESTYESFSAIPPGETGILLCTDVASRGLDIPDVDFVIQWDPPTDPKSFAHRCGRTARAGRSGQALVFLSPGSEEAYVDFLALRKIPMMPANYLWLDDEGNVTLTAPKDAVITEAAEESDEESDSKAGGGGGSEGDSEEDPERKGKEQTKKRKRTKRRSALRIQYPADTRSDSMIEMLRGLAATDRDIYERGKLAFVSFIQSYSKHEATFIFRLKELAIIEVAKGFALLHLPSMPEFRGRPTGRFVKYNIDTDAIPFIDGKRENQRLAKLEAAREEARKAALAKDKDAEKQKKKKNKQNNTDAWSEAKEAKERTRERKLKRIKKRDALASAEEQRLMAEINDPSLKEMLAKDPLLAKRMLNHRDKSLRDMAEIAAKAHGKEKKPARKLEDIISEAKYMKRRSKYSSDDSSSDSEPEEDDWEMIARKEKVRARLAKQAMAKRKRFTFDPGFSDDEAEDQA
ncbi:DEAD-domain-containing protein [Martensiomyces pterosporus]|nr:DEAD-domain-containing protein [Martensiomyces pterosporus]